VSQTKYCCSLKVKIFGTSQNFGLTTPLACNLSTRSGTGADSRVAAICKVCVSSCNYTILEQGWRYGGEVAVEDDVTIKLQATSLSSFSYEQK